MYIMLIPAVASMLLFNYYPMLGNILAFKEFRFDMSMWESPWVGFTYFKTFFNYPQAGQLIINTLVISLSKILLAYPFPIILALMLNEINSVKLKKVFQTVSYLPHFVAWVVVVAVIQRMFAPNTGMINEMLAMFGGDKARYWLMEPGFFYPIMFFSHVWKSIGWNSIIFLAAITSINPEYFEAAKIDGATKWQEIRLITLPCISQTVGIIFILSLGGILSAGYEQIYLLRTPGNAIYADILDTYVIRQGLEQGQFGYATSVNLIQGVTGLLLVVISNWLSKRYTETSIW